MKTKPKYKNNFKCAQQTKTEENDTSNQKENV